MDNNEPGLSGEVRGTASDTSTPNHILEQTQQLLIALLAISTGIQQVRIRIDIERYRY